MMKLSLRSSTNGKAESVPPLMHLRLPAALLAGLSNESCLVMSQTEDGSREELGNGKRKETDDAWSLTISHDGARKQTCECYELEVAAHHQRDCYQSTATSKLPKSKMELCHIGTTNKEYTLKQKSRNDLKEIGKRTRKTLEEQRKKRKEIVRLDDSELPPLPTKGGTTMAQKPTPEEADKMPPKKSEKKRNARVRRGKRRVAPNVDGWVPTVDTLMPNAEASNFDRSSIVRVHGLPHGTKPEQIRKFFRGLDPFLIFVLPSFTKHIEGWEAKYNTHGGGRPAVPRHSSNFRVFVKFESAPVAETAIERSGEAIGLSEKQKFMGATIALSPVPKYVASFLQKYMVSLRFNRHHLLLLHPVFALWEIIKFFVIH